MGNKNETRAYIIIKNIFIVWVLVLIIGSLIFHEFLLGGESTAVWIFFFITLGYVIKNGGHKRVECLSELQFYDDYLIFYVPKYHISRGKDQMEIQKIFYNDVTKCEFRTYANRIVICGMMEESHYKYDKNNNLDNIPCYHKTYDGMITFYTDLDYEHDFIGAIEKNTPLKVNCRNS